MALPAALGDGGHGDDRGNAEDDAEHGQETAQLVREEPLVQGDVQEIGDEDLARGLGGWLRLGSGDGFAR